jgi:hypothetical protein
MASTTLQESSMSFPVVNNVAVLVSGVVIFLLGGLWYSPLLLAKRWVALIGKSEEELKANAGNMPASYLFVFLCGLVTAWVMALVVGNFAPATAVDGAVSARSAGSGSPERRASGRRCSPASRRHCG